MSLVLEGAAVRGPCRPPSAPPSGDPQGAESPPQPWGRGHLLVPELCTGREPPSSLTCFLLALQRPPGPWGPLFPKPAPLSWALPPPTGLPWSSQGPSTTSPGALAPATVPGVQLPSGPRSIHAPHACLGLTYTMGQGSLPCSFLGGSEEAMCVKQVPEGSRLPSPPASPRALLSGALLQHSPARTWPRF